MHSGLLGAVIVVVLQLPPLPEGIVWPAPGQLPTLDFTLPRVVGPTAVDLSLGFTARCAGCAFSIEGGRFIGRVTDYPVVTTVAPGGVADEAGLRPGDLITLIAGRDVRSFVGDSPLFALPELDFLIGYRRDARDVVTFLNRRIVDQRGLSEPPPKVEGHWAVVVRGMQLRADRPDPTVRESTGPRFLVEPTIGWLDPEGAAAAVGLQIGDVVVGANGAPVFTAEGGQALLATAPGLPLRLTVRRGGRLLSATIPPSS